MHVNIASENIMVPAAAVMVVSVNIFEWGGLSAFQVL